MSKPVELLSWVWVVIRANAAQRNRLVHAVMEGIRAFNSKDGKPTKDGDSLASELQSMELVGFTPNIMYVKARGNKNQLEALYVHPWGTAKLLYKHKKLPILVIAGSDLRFNKSVLHEVPANKYNEWVKGLTG